MVQRIGDFVRVPLCLGAMIRDDDATTHAGDAGIVEVFASFSIGTKSSHCIDETREPQTTIKCEILDACRVSLGLGVSKMAALPVFAIAKFEHVVAHFGLVFLALFRWWQAVDKVGIVDMVFAIATRAAWGAFMAMLLLSVKDEDIRGDRIWRQHAEFLTSSVIAPAHASFASGRSRHSRIHDRVAVSIGGEVDDAFGFRGGVDGGHDRTEGGDQHLCGLAAMVMAMVGFLTSMVD